MLKEIQKEKKEEKEIYITHEQTKIMIKSISDFSRRCKHQQVDLTGSLSGIITI